MGTQRNQCPGAGDGPVRLITHPPSPPEDTTTRSVFGACPTPYLHGGTSRLLLPAPELLTFPKGAVVACRAGELLRLIKLRRRLRLHSPPPVPPRPRHGAGSGPLLISLSQERAPSLLAASPAHIW